MSSAAASGGRCFEGVLERHVFADEVLVLALGVVDAQDLVVLEETMEVEIGNDHLAGAETSAVNDVVGIHVDEARFRAGNDEAAVVEREAAGAQAVAVEDGADLVAVSKCKRGRTVPWFDAVAAVLKKRRRVAGIGRRNDHAHGFADGAAVVGEEFDNLVERGGVGAALRQHRIHVERQRGGSGFHARAIAPDGVDFAVVREGAEGLRALPRGKNVGGVALVKEREWRLEFGIGEVGIELREQAAGAERLVDHRGRRDADEVAGQFGALKLLAREEEAAIEEFRVVGSDEQVPDFGARRVGDFAEHFRADRHGAPGEHFHILLEESGFDFVTLAVSSSRQEERRLRRGGCSRRARGCTGRGATRAEWRW